MLLRFLLVAAIVASPTVAGQAAPQASLALDMSNEMTNVDLGSSHSLPFSVTLTLSGIVCASASQAKVPVTVQDKPSPLAGVKGTSKPAELSFEVPAGSYASSPYSKTLDGELDISVASDAMADHEHTFAVTASYAGGTPAGCQGTGSIAATDATAEHMIMTGKGSGGASVPTHQMSDGSAMQGEAMSSSKETPWGGLVLIGLAVVGAMLLRRR